jgi:hypothetical protein
MSKLKIGRALEPLLQVMAGDNYREVKRVANIILKTFDEVY